MEVKSSLGAESGVKSGMLVGGVCMIACVLA